LNVKKSSVQIIGKPGWGNVRNPKPSNWKAKGEKIFGQMLGKSRGTVRGSFCTGWWGKNWVPLPKCVWDSKQWRGGIHQMTWGGKVETRMDRMVNGGLLVGKGGLNA